MILLPYNVYQNQVVFAQLWPLNGWLNQTAASTLDARPVLSLVLSECATKSGLQLNMTLYTPATALEGLWFGHVTCSCGALAHLALEALDKDGSRLLVEGLDVALASTGRGHCDEGISKNPYD